ncbi:hypothetical protein H0H81_000844 [Sphagnurus paluster]|uniref:Deacetylase sirtuin-type domain-containing protein n=1 Tax=Sphagnurus paluster TaxID=117069 RepID=A0A9P7KGZ6_9AGAR|nr:hypothetical protein H0H81_000844 [Sphagnurus paluster]
MSLATPEAFNENPSLVWQFYHYRRRRALEAKPNDGHKTLAKLAIPRLLKIVAPAAQSFNLITQNVDGLSVIAANDLASELSAQNLVGAENSAPEDSLLQMHGKLFELQCTECSWRKDDFSHPLCSALGEAEEDIHNFTDAGSKPHDIPSDQLPRCPECQALARPAVVWFGEVPYYMDEIDSLVSRADMCLVVGTSSTVQPAASYAFEVQENYGKVAVFNIDPSKIDAGADYVFRGGCEETLPNVFPELAD